MDTPAELRAKVKAVNDLFRTSLMNRKYYARRLTWFNRCNKTLEILVAVGSSSAVAGWGFWKLMHVGGATWGVLSGVAALLAVLKPTLQLPKEIERYSKRHLGYCSLYYDLDMIVFDMQMTKSLNAANWKSFLHLKKRNGELGIHDEINPKEKVLSRCRDEVMKEVPKGSLWLPPKETAEATT
jgi:hypothetical protein